VSHSCESLSSLWHFQMVSTGLKPSPSISALASLCSALFFASQIGVDGSKHPSAAVRPTNNLGALKYKSMHTPEKIAKLHCPIKFLRRNRTHSHYGLFCLQGKARSYVLYFIIRVHILGEKYKAYTLQQHHEITLNHHTASS